MKVKNIKFKGRLDGRKKDNPNRSMGELLPNGWLRFPDGKLIPACRVEECAAVDDQSKESEASEASTEEAGGEKKGRKRTRPSKASGAASAGRGAGRK